MIIKHQPGKHSKDKRSISNWINMINHLS